MKKIFVLDTNVPMHDPEALLHFEENGVILPIEVIEELDALKRGKGEVPFSARHALRLIDSFREGGDISAGVKLPNGGVLQVVQSGRVKNLLDNTSDNRIISVALELKEKGQPVILVSKDTAVRIKAEALGLTAQDYTTDKTTVFAKYGRILDETVPHCNGIHSLRFITVGGQTYAVKGDGDERLPVRNREVFDVKARNLEQQCALMALMREDIEVVALTGKAGTGKTFLALAAGVDQATKLPKPFYEQVLVARPIVPMGNELGFLPGDVAEKLDPWMQPIYDNLDALVVTPPEDDSLTGRKSGGSAKKRYKNSDYLLERIVQVQALTHIRGRSLPRRFMIIDEAQNLRPLDVKTIITRCGEGTKIVFTGDLDQIDDPFLDAQSNGLSYLIARFINEPEFCYLNLTSSVRSRLADKAARLL